MDTYIKAYQRGEYVATWQTFVALDLRVRDRSIHGEALDVARETMKRVRHNVETVYQRLQAIGYQFDNPAQAFVPPDGETPASLEAIERRLGRLPLSLQAFYEEVGSVNFMQANSQLRQWQHPERAQASELQLLGEEDPLVVFPLSHMSREVDAAGQRLYFCFAPDEFHKANYSGGENYHVWLPDERADFRIQGMYDMDEYFVNYLRATLAQGGFRGRLIADTEPPYQKPSYKQPPQMKLMAHLTGGLLPF